MKCVMSSSNVNKSVLSPASQLDSEETDAQSQSSSASETVLRYIRYEHKIEQSLKISQKEDHHKRMQSLRKELDYLNNTAWQFESADKNTGF